MIQTHTFKVCLFTAIIAITSISYADTTTKIVPSQPITALAAHARESAAVPTFKSISMKDLGLRPMTAAEFASAMCIMGASSGLSLTYMLGPNEIIMLVVGGVVVPSSPSILFLSLFSTMAAAGCSIAAASTPAISWVAERVVIPYF